MILLFLLIILNQPNYAAFGDSITAGVNVQPGQSYVSLLANDIGEIDNGGAVGGSNLWGQVASIEAYTGPAMTYIWLPGYNDMRAGTPLDAYEAELRHGLDIIKARGVVVYLGACLPMTEDGYELLPQNSGSNSRVEAMNALTRRVVQDYPNVIFVEFPAYDPGQDISDDRVHPNAAGQRVIYEAFKAALGRRIWFPVILYRLNDETIPAEARLNMPVSPIVVQSR